MSKNVAVAAAVALALGLVPLAHAKKEGKADREPAAAQHMSGSGWENANSPATGTQMKGDERSAERKSDQGLMHDHPDKKVKDQKKEHKVKGGKH